MVLDSNQIIGGLIGLGLVAKGIAEWWLRSKGQKVPSVKGDTTHEELKDLMKSECQKINDKLIEVLAIIKERK